MQIFSLVITERWIWNEIKILFQCNNWWLLNYCKKNWNFVLVDLYSSKNWKFPLLYYSYTNTKKMIFTLKQPKYLNHKFIIPLFFYCMADFDDLPLFIVIITGIMSVLPYFHTGNTHKHKCMIWTTLVPWAPPMLTHTRLQYMHQLH